MRQKFIVSLFSLLLVTQGCSGGNDPSEAVTNYFESLQAHDSAAFLASLSAEEAAEWPDPVSAPRMTYNLVTKLSFHYDLRSPLRSDSSIAVDIVFDSASDERLQKSVPLKSVQHLRVFVEKEEKTWKVREIQKAASNSN